MLAVALLPAAAQAAPAKDITAPQAVVVTVDTTSDPNPTSLTQTCTYTGGIFVAASPCSLRRAIMEASARPRADLPISITFNITTTDPGYNASLGVWTINQGAAAMELKTPSIVDLTGNTTIDGATQPGGRSSGGPKIFIDTNDFSLQIRSTGNTIRNLGFYGGGIIDVYRNGNTIENIWMGLSADGQSVVFRTPGNTQRMAGGGVFLRSDNNTVRNSVITGAFARAISIEGGDNNTISGNRIGTRADGTVPAIDDSVKCDRNLTATGALWYGGWGIQTSGTANSIVNNRIAGLHIVQSANDTPPMAIEVFGFNHVIQNNTIGVDSAGYEAGVCGVGIKVSGNGTQILDNTIVKSRKGFDGNDNVDAAILESDSSPQFGSITVRRNIVRDAALRVVGFNINVDTLALFKPAKITSIDGTAVTGISGEGSPCPNCIVDLYTDDADGKQEALTYVGSAIADGNGNWSFTLPAPLTAGAGLRTMSTPQNSSIIGSYGAGTTTGISERYVEEKKVYLPLTVR